MSDRAFAGAKLLPFIGNRLLVVQRDFTPGIVWPGWHDLPGGMREGAESPMACALRETREEVGLVLAEDDLRLAHLQDISGRRVWFFAAHLPASHATGVVLGDEGLGWQLMPPDVFATHPRAIPTFRTILRVYMEKGRERAVPGQ
ncbi:NUDIX domain-containing protein [Thetidibacter halocola]|uniref:NUDIX domain-containing protein n=1 Tax=Thetidibacter halocola TaxID=2827239 RepID=A0A8J7WII9_9RHOB|nr:NUDIX domain-containing protein [Thetidibacter halocola]MBS0125728.1 NUDIX domain-containing protein [Thetidibacter halocola]